MLKYCFIPLQTMLVTFPFPKMTFKRRSVKHNKYGNFDQMIIYEIRNFRSL